MNEQFDMLDGSNCPCCGQLVKIYRRKLYGQMAYQLILLYKMGGGFHHIKKLGNPAAGGGDFAKLRYWGLVVEKPNPNDPSKRTSGYWCITLKGIQFVEGNINLPTHCNIYNGQVKTFSTTLGSIKKALGIKFNYAQLMGGL